MSSSPPENERVGRPVKRRRISKARTVNHQTGRSPSLSSSSTVDHNQPRGQSRSPQKENEKPGNKYKIHIPKDDTFPDDVFFTQPPQRSNSPWRIEDFHWQKPERALPDPVQKVPVAIPDQRSVPLRHNSKDSPLAVKTIAESNNDGIEIVPDGAYNFDISDEDLLADLSEPQNQNGRMETPVSSDDSSRGSKTAHHSEQSEARSQLVRTSSNLKQTTLFGTQANTNVSSQNRSRQNWPMANRQEPPTHHEIDRKAMETWVYPINLGTIRDYQYSITATGLYHNTLVALPTGLGKTFIAATIMLNWYRWTKYAQIVFVAPTKPLVAQQVKACFEIAGIPRSTTSMLTGSFAPGLRAEEWQRKRVFFMTPQTLINDLKSGICDPKRLVLIVVDEAHRATGSYAYVEVVKFVKRFNESFRVLALTATPGGTIENVQAVIDGLTISRVEIRTEDSLDIRQFIHTRKVETKLFDNSPEMDMILELFAKSLQPATDKLHGLNAFWSRDPLSLTPYGCKQASDRWSQSNAGRNAQPGLKNMVRSIFQLLGSLSYATELLKFHGMGPFYHKLLAFRNELHAGGKKGGKEANSINNSKDFQTMMSRLQIWINSSDFIGHPKLEYVQRVVMNHFLDAGEGRSGVDPSSTRVMIFAHYRQSAEEVARILKRNEPMIRPHVFVGQSSVKDSEGMDQKKQLDLINKFQSGTYNTLVATSIGEEGLDIGEVDLIICYDASSSPIRMLQRMGRTGRKRAGNIVVTLMRGKEENNFAKAKDNYDKMQQEIASGAKFAFHEDTVRRIVPKDIQPSVNKCVVDIPIENTQAGLPEPAKRGRPPKRPPKKFHMPDDVHTGFRKASRLYDSADTTDDEITRERIQIKAVPCVPEPLLSEVVLTAQQQKLFEQNYLEISGDVSEMVSVPPLDRFPTLQRSLRPHQHIRHGIVTRRLVTALSSNISGTAHLDPRDKESIDRQGSERASFFSQASQLLTSSAHANGLDDSTKDDASLASTDDDERLSIPPSSDRQATKCASSLEHDLDETDDDLPDLEKMIQVPARKAVGPEESRPRRARNNVLEDDSDD